MKLNQYEWNPEKDLIAQGAFAEVFKAKDTNSQDRYVALKIYKEAVVKGTSGSTGQEKYTLEKEFQKIDGLSHTNIITYFGINYIKHKDALGRSSSYPVIIMEYASEGTLQDFIKTNPDTKILDKIIQDIIQGVSYLHDEGIIHRDLKPGNILITKNRKGEPVAKITDFGISRDTLTDKTIEESFTEGIGTPHYMAPEQFFKKKFGLKGEISERTDIWALGVVIYRALTNKLPFGHGSKDYELIRDAITNDKLELKTIPKKYKVLLERCFQKKATKRPHTAHKLFDFIGNKEIDVIEKTKNGINTGWESEEETLINKQPLKENKPAPFIKHTLLQKILVIVFGIINISWFFNYFLKKEIINNVQYFDLIYPIIVLWALILFFKKQILNHFVHYFVYGFLLFFSFFMVALSISGNQGIIGKTEFNFYWIFYSLFHLGFSFWMFKKQTNFKFIDLKKNNINTNIALVISITVLAYFVSYGLNIYGEVLGYVAVINLIETQILSLTLLPNIFFVTVILVFLTNKHIKYSKTMLFLFAFSIIIASIWWLLLEKGRSGMTMLSLMKSQTYIQEFKTGYYFWFLSIFVGFCVILYDALKNHSWKKYYWTVLVSLVIVLMISFSFQWSKSKIGYDFNNGIKTLNVSQFNDAIKNGADLDWDKDIMSTSLKKYSDSRPYKVSQFVKAVISSGWNGEDYRGKEALKEAILTKDVRIIEQILNTKAKKYINDTTYFGKSRLKEAIELDNPEIVELLLKADAKPRKDEKLFDAPRSEKMTKILKNYDLDGDAFYYLDTFENGSEKFKESSDFNGVWSNINGEYKCYSKTDSYVIKKTSNFNIDVTKEYTVEVKTRITFTGMEYGIVFDDNGISYHILVFDDTMLKVYKFNQYQWTEEYNVSISAKHTNKLKLVKKGNYITCYFNGSQVLKNKYIKNFKGNKLGMIIFIPKKNAIVQFDDFKVIGTVKK